MLHSDKVIYKDKEWRVVGIENPDNGRVIIERRVFGVKITKRVDVDELRDA